MVSRRFIEGNSIVEDLYDGNLDSLFSSLKRDDYALVMYYAPWDWESQKSKPHFISTANDLHDQVINLQFLMVTLEKVILPYSPFFFPHLRVRELGVIIIINVLSYVLDL